MQQENLKINFLISNSSMTSKSTPDSKEMSSNLKKMYELVIQYSQLSRYELAAPLCRQAIQEAKKTYGHEHPHVATLFNILSKIYRCQHRYKEAANQLNEALLIREKIFGKDHLLVRDTINRLAVLYAKCNKKKAVVHEVKLKGIEVRGRAVEMNACQTSKRSLKIRENCFNIIVSKAAQLERNQTILSNSNRYLSRSIPIK